MASSPIRPHARAHRARLLLRPPAARVPRVDDRAQRGITRDGSREMGCAQGGQGGRRDGGEETVGRMVEGGGGQGGIKCSGRWGQIGWSVCVLRWANARQRDCLYALTPGCYPRAFKLRSTVLVSLVGSVFSLAIISARGLCFPGDLVSCTDAHGHLDCFLYFSSDPVQGRKRGGRRRRKRSAFASCGFDLAAIPSPGTSKRSSRGSESEDMNQRTRRT